MVDLVIALAVMITYAAGAVAASRVFENSMWAYGWFEAVMSTLWPLAVVGRIALEVYAFLYWRVGPGRRRRTTGGLPRARVRR